MAKKKYPLYRRWKAMLDRCYKKNHSQYKYYGVKGITVCEQWQDFWNFVHDVDNHLKKIIN